MGNLTAAWLRNYDEEKQKALKVVKRTRSQRKLALIAQEAADYEVWDAAFKKLTDPSLLGQVAQQAKSSHRRIDALERLVDPALLWQAAEQDTSSEVREKARRLLCGLSGHSWNGCVCEGCTEHRHQWGTCACEVCGAERDRGSMFEYRGKLTPHDFEEQPDSCMCKCRACGEEVSGSWGAADWRHKWEPVAGLQCLKRCVACSREREDHCWQPAPSDCRQVCSTCGKIWLNDSRPHNVDEHDVCLDCKQYIPYKRCDRIGHVAPATGERCVRCREPVFGGHQTAEAHGIGRTGW
jgi:hypothetical protein